MTSHRYHRQTLLEGIGTEGQERLRSASVLVAGVGALGCAVADHLVRAGIGHLRLIDRDLVEPTNLQRQCLFAEDDLGSPKATAAANRLQAINHEVKLEAVVDDLRPAVAYDMVEGCDGIADGEVKDFDAPPKLSGMRLEEPITSGKILFVLEKFVEKYKS